MKDIDWKILKVLYEKKSITQAAKVLYVTQSALTKRLKAIEEEWNVEIVKRSSKGILFTEEGRYLVNKANIMLDFLNEIEQHFENNRASKDLLKMGVPNSFARLHMPKLFRKYKDHFGNLQIKTRSNSSDVIIKHLTDGTIDIGIVCGDYPYLGEKVCLFEENLYVIAPKDVTLDDIEHMPLIESYLNPMVGLIIEQWWKHEFGSMPHEEHYVPYSDIAIEMVENGLGICFVFGTDWKINDEKLKRIPLYDADNVPISRNVWMMLSENCYKSEDIMDFVTFVEKYYQVN